jgi:hypothetical protein
LISYRKKPDFIRFFFDRFIFFYPDYVIGFLRPDKVRGDACPVFTGSVAISRKSGCLKIGAAGLWWN